MNKFFKNLKKRINKLVFLFQINKYIFILTCIMSYFMCHLGGCFWMRLIFN